jgi:hypothetical protein
MGAYRPSENNIKRWMRFQKVDQQEQPQTDKYRQLIGGRWGRFDSMKDLQI